MTPASPGLLRSMLPYLRQVTGPPVIGSLAGVVMNTALREHIQPTGTAILSVAHRLSTTRAAHRVIVLSRGRIVAAMLALEEAGWV